MSIVQIVLINNADKNMLLAKKTLFWAKPSLLWAKKNLFWAKRIIMFLELKLMLQVFNISYWGNVAAIEVAHKRRMRWT